MNMREQLHVAEEILYGNVREYGRCYVLVDQVFGDAFEDELVEWDALLKKTELSHRLFPKGSGLAPLLFEIAPERFNVAVDMLCLAHAYSAPAQTIRPVCAFLAGPVTLDVLGRRLSHSLEARLEDNPPFYFRYFDPRVFSHLGNILSVEQIEDMCGGAQKWMCFSDSGRFLSFDVNPSGKWVHRHETKLRVSQDQWRKLDSLEVVNLAIRRLSEQGNEIPTFTALFPLANHAMGALPNEDDRVDLVVRRFNHPELTLRDPSLDQAIRMCCKHGIPFEMAYQQAAKATTSQLG